ncbi:hypothetical protein QE152_g21663 [Popillia japonica]|uniref:Uncharacterized protein n=1 Tax=Popillia japonica TaxID=7064 RepID=A0AAW1KNR4_POPJA
MEICTKLVWDLLSVTSISLLDYLEFLPLGPSVAYKVWFAYQILLGGADEFAITFFFAFNSIAKDLKAVLHDGLLALIMAFLLTYKYKATNFTFYANFREAHINEVTSIGVVLGSGDKSFNPIMEICTKLRHRQAVHYVHICERLDLNNCLKEVYDETGIRVDFQYDRNLNRNRVLNTGEDTK